MFAPGAGRFLGPVGAVLAVTVLVAALGLWTPFFAPALLSAALAVLLGFFLIFFRDPPRAPGEGIVSAADGRVREVAVEGDLLRVSVFMNVTDVHVNRFPLAATVEEVRPGGAGHRPAYQPDARHNVQQTFRLATTLGPVEVVQMTGVVARRLVSFVRPGDRAAKGDRLGMIVLGSRVDVLLPSARTDPLVHEGSTVRAGETPIARERP